MRRYCALLLSIFCVGIFAFHVYAASDVPKEVLESCDSVVRIETIYDDGFGTGSGFVVAADDEQTLILTNHHVAVEGNPTGIYVLLNDEADIPASVIASDKNKDLALLKVSYPLGMKPIKLSENGAEKGEAIYVIGFPGAADSLSTDVATTHDDSTITDGIVSAIRELDINSSGKSAEVLQLNAAINPGNSGGPVVNKKGEAVGVSTYSVEDSQGVYGAISVDEVKSFLDENRIEYETQQNNVIVFIIAGVVLIGIIVLIIVLISKKKHKTSQSSTEWTFVNTENTEDVKKTQKNPSGSVGKVIAIVACSLVVLTIAGYFVTMGLSQKAADEHRFADAYDLIIVKPLTETIDRQYCDYVYAGMKMEFGKYDEARELFSNLSGYKDSDDMIIACDYQKGKELLASGQYDGAKELFEMLNSNYQYKDSSTMMLECDYQKACGLLANEEYESALELLESLGNYSDSKILGKEIQYQMALKYMDNKEYTEAVKILRLLSDEEYKDSEDKLIECWILNSYNIFCERGDSAAYKIIKKYADDGNKLALDLISDSTEGLYRSAVDKYNQIMNDSVADKALAIEGAIGLFSLIEDYKDSKQYLDSLYDIRIFDFSKW